MNLIKSKFKLPPIKNHLFSLRNQFSDKNFHDFSKDRKLTALELQHLHRKGKKISMITAYDYPSAKHAENAGFDIILVGDSLGMVVLGYETTQPVTMEDMLHHCKAVRRGAPSRFIVGDMPFGSYESSPDEALKNAFKFIKEAQVDAVKLEGGSLRKETVKKIVDSGIPVMGHIGLTPQGIGTLGGFRAQGRTAVKARSIVDDALSLQEAGAFAIGLISFYYLLLF
jgi:3-methyl-2-oxobutanoate hydroxymethyltransferase